MMKPSRLTQARGLKRVGVDLVGQRRSSRLTQARGLKHARVAVAVVFVDVAPHAGAWIETRSGCGEWRRSGSRASRRRVD